MPIYEYVCRACRHEFEELTRSMSDRDAARCPACSSADVDRKLSRFAAHQGSSNAAGVAACDACSTCCHPGGPCPMDE